MSNGKQILKIRHRHSKHGSQWKKPNQANGGVNIMFTLNQTFTTICVIHCNLFFRLCMWNWKHRFSCCSLFIAFSEFHSSLRIRRFGFCVVFDFTLVVIVIFFFSFLWRFLFSFCFVFFFSFNCNFVDNCGFYICCAMYICKYGA